MALPTPIANIEDLMWTATRYSDVLKIERRLVAQALETVKSSARATYQVWHVRDAMPAIFRQYFGIDKAFDDPGKMQPKDRLDHYKAEREKIKLEIEKEEVIYAHEVEKIMGESFKILAQSLSIIPDTMERECGLAPDVIKKLHESIDAARETLYLSLTRYARENHSQG